MFIYPERHHQIYNQFGYIFSYIQPTLFVELVYLWDCLPSLTHFDKGYAEYQIILISSALVQQPYYPDLLELSVCLPLSSSSSAQPTIVRSGLPTFMAPFTLHLASEHKALAAKEAVD